MTPNDPSLSVPGLLQAARSADAQGRFAQAEELSRQALVNEPHSTAARVQLGIALAKQFKLDAAEAELRQTAEANAQSYESRLWLSRIARRAGRLDESIQRGEEAWRLQPDTAEAQINLALSLIDGKEFARAAELLSAAATTQPNAPPLFLHLGNSLEALGRLEEALAAYQRAIQLQPRMSDALVGTARIYLSSSNAAAAVDAAERAVAANPKSAPAHHIYLESLMDSGRGAIAETHARGFVASNPSDAKAFALLGKCLLAIGKLQSARQALEQSIALQPRQGTAYCLLAQSRPEVDKALVARMTQVSSDAELSPLESSYLQFGLGIGYEALGEYEQAIKNFDSANRLAYRVKFGSRTFDRDAYAARTDWMIETFGPEVVERLSATGSHDQRPIFIVGMIRSGTTLVEQILACHPDVAAGGEIRFWQLHGQLASSGEGLDVSSLLDTADTYERLLSQLGPGKIRVTDKLPENFYRLGLLHIAFPNARIIHTRRNPIDTCVSIYTTPNSAANEFAHDADNIAFAYREYLRLMKHWRTVLPPSAMLEVAYEDLVTNPEREARRLVAFCGLTWDRACLRPEEAKHAVNTPSAGQVRRGFYQTSVGRAERFRPWLGPFADLPSA